jgi:lipid-A-disaccharide synthase-like uncharacterized protein
MMITWNPQGFWHGWILGTAAAYIIGSVVCIVMFLVTGRSVFLLAYLICVFGARLSLNLEKSYREEVSQRHEQT